MIFQAELNFIKYLLDREIDISVGEQYLHQILR